MLIWVDDILVFSGEIDAISVLKELSKYVELEMKGIPKRFVGLDINVNNNSISMSQHTYASAFDVRDCPILENPLPLNVLKEEDKSPLLKGKYIKAYRSLLGSLSFLQHTRLDLVFAISFFGKVTHAPTERMFRLVYRACQYAKQTSRRGINFDIKFYSSFKIEAWCDASFGSHLNSAQTG